MKAHHTSKISYNKVWLVAYSVIGLSSLAVYCLIRLNVIEPLAKFQPMLQKASLAGFFAIVILFAAKLIELIILRRSGSRYARYNLMRVVHLFSFIGVAFLIVSFLFKNWYAAAVSLGLISLILGFALQTPISSFIGWIYIIIRNPYRIGDRIQINTFRGDVIKIGYMDTSLWEFAGDYLTNDLPSGRLIRFPNSLVLQSPVLIIPGVILNSSGMRFLSILLTKAS